MGGGSGTQEGGWGYSKEVGAAAREAAGVRKLLNVEKKGQQ